MGKVVGFFCGIMACSFFLLVSLAFSVTYYVDLNPPTDPTAPLGSLANPFPTIQAAANAVAAGDVVEIRGGTYIHTGGVREFVTVSTSGTAALPITFQNYGVEIVILQGRGYEDQDLSPVDGKADGPIGLTNEKLFLISANYIQVKNLAFTNSNRWGVYIGGDHNLVENCSSHDNWEAGFTTDGNNNILRTLEAHHNRHRTGIEIRQSGTRTANDNLIENSISYYNGYQADDTKVLPATGDAAGGGNSDGIGGFKDCADAAPVGQNLCERNSISGNVSWHNTDGGFDFAFAKSILKNNISFDNGFTGVGQVGYKILRVVADLVFVQNVSYSDLGPGYEFRVTNGVYLHNMTVDNTGAGFSMLDEGTPTFRNNMGAFNVGADLPGPCAQCSNNWAEDTNGNPLLNNSGPFKDGQGNIVVNFPAGSTIAGKVSFVKNTFQSAFSLQATSGALDAGIASSYVDPYTGQTVNISFQGAAPDISAYEAEGGNPPSPATPTGLIVLWE